MRYLKLYKEFYEYDKDVLTKDSEIENELLDREIKDENSFIDSKGVIHIKNWKLY